MGHHDRMKAADTYHSIHPNSFIVSCKNVRLEKRTGTATNTYTRELHGKRHDLTWLTFFSDIFKILSLQMPELWLIHLFKANILSFLYIYSKLAMPNEIYDVDFPKQTNMTNMAATPMYGKTLKKSSSPEQAGRFSRNFVCSIRDPSPS